MNKRIAFLLFIIVGIISISLSMYLLEGLISSIPEYVALFTSISTAMYAILAEPKTRTEPILRLTPLKTKYAANLLRYDLDVWIENIGYSVAKDIEVKCKLAGTSRYANKEKVFNHSLLAPKEIIKFSVTECAEEVILNERLNIKVTYSNEAGKKQKTIEEEYSITELGSGLREVKTS